MPSSAGIDPAGTSHRWHILDNAGELNGRTPVGTLLCVHGNPTWSYLWRTVLAAGATTDQPWRVIAVDQLDMGYSERTGTFRRLADRITDLGDLTAALQLTGPVVTAGHDWGGAISLGWALAHQDQLAGIVLTNTAVWQPPQYGIPPALQLALHPAVHSWGTVTTPAFLQVTHALAHPALAPEVRKAFRAPYRTASRRAGVGNFVADIPVGPEHPSYAALTGVADGIRGLNVPALLLWGPRDPVFSDRYLRDLICRLPAARVHRFEGAGHLLHEDVDVAAAVLDWLDDTQSGASMPDGKLMTDTTRHASAAEITPTTDVIERAPRSDFRPLGAELERRRDEKSPAVVDMAPRGTGRKTTTAPRILSWAQLHRNVQELAVGLTAAGVRPGSRVSLLVPPGSELTALIYACVRLGAVVVLADAGLGPKGLSRAVQGAGPDFVIGIERALLAARAFGWPGVRISLEPLPRPARVALQVRTSLLELTAGAATAVGPSGLPPLPDPDSLAAVLFTSGSTGPAKGVLYTQRQLAAMRDTLAATYDLRAGTALVAGFAPFALLGPALGATSVTPDMDVTAPRTLRAQTLAAAVAAIDATAVFLSPAALRNVLDTAADLGPADRNALAGVSLLLSAGAPVPATLLEAAAELLPAARLHTPYGMTEALPVTDIELADILAAEAAAAAGEVPGAGNGVCVGRSVPGVQVAVSPLDATGQPSPALSTEAGITGEIVVQAPHAKNGYDRLWLTQRTSDSVKGWHRTGDVGHFDAEGRLWVEGRLAHVITTASGVLTPVAGEQLAESVPGIRRAAVVGVGPAGRQVPVAVVETSPAVSSPALAPAALSARLRHAFASSPALRPVASLPVASPPEASHRATVAVVPLAAVLVVPDLPTDIRHNAKVDRARLSAWASGVLAGGRLGRP
ncbi:MAG: hydrolase [Micrococcaceae bacterium]|nr:hydrolase [Micrococcaceae bacterium]